jgi:hypothetical protein
MSVSEMYLQEAREHAHKAETAIAENKGLIHMQAEATLAQAWATMALVVVTRDPTD